MPRAKKTRKPRLGVGATFIGLPDDVHAWVRERAAAEQRSITVVIVRALAAERARTEQQAA